MAQSLAAVDSQVNHTNNTNYEDDTDPNNQAAADDQIVQSVNENARIDLKTGRLSPEELFEIFRLLPVDLTFVDREDKVRWYSDIPDRLFLRAKSVIGRSVYNCHPPKALTKVKRILTSFHEGTSDREEYWFNLHGEKFIHIEYIAVWRDDGTYLGYLEVGQDATYLRGLTCEKRR